MTPVISDFCNLYNVRGNCENYQIYFYFDKSYCLKYAYVFHFVVERSKEMR